jgi:hypothetical protein
VIARGAWSHTHDKNVDLPTSASPSNNTVTSGMNFSEAMLETDATRASWKLKAASWLLSRAIGMRAVSKGDDGGYR